MSHLIGVELHARGLSAARFQAPSTFELQPFDERPAPVPGDPYGGWKWSLGVARSDALALLAACESFAALERSLGEGDIAAAFAVPARWNGAALTTLVRAVEATALEPVALVRETTALAVGMATVDPTLSGRVAVVDLGVNSFEVCVVELAATSLRVLGRAGEAGAELAQRSLDEMLARVQHLGRKVCADAGVRNGDLRAVLGTGRRFATPAVEIAVKETWGLSPVVVDGSTLARGAARVGAGRLGLLPPWHLDDARDATPLPTVTSPALQRARPHVSPPPVADVVVPARPSVVQTRSSAPPPPPRQVPPRPLFPPGPGRSVPPPSRSALPPPRVIDPHDRHAPFTPGASVLPPPRVTGAPFSIPPAPTPGPVRRPSAPPPAMPTRSEPPTPVSMLPPRPSPLPLTLDDDVSPASAETNPPSVAPADARHVEPPHEHHRWHDDPHDEHHSWHHDDHHDEHPSIAPPAEHVAPVPTVGSFVGVPTLEGLCALHPAFPADVITLRHPDLFTLLNQFTFLRGYQGVLTLKRGGESVPIPVLRGGVCLATQDRSRALRAFEWPDGAFTWHPEAIPLATAKLRMPLTPFYAAALRACLRSHDDAELTRHHHGKLHLSPVPIPERASRLRRLGLLEQEERALDHALDGSRALEKLLGEGFVGRTTLQRLVVMLDLFGILRWARPTVSDVVDPREEMQKLYKSIAGPNHFVALGVHWSATPAEILGSWETMQRLYGPGGERVAIDRGIADLLHRRAHEAWDVLRDDIVRIRHRREMYPGIDEELLAPLVEARAKSLEMRGELTEAQDMLRLRRDLKLSTEPPREGGER